MGGSLSWENNTQNVLYGGPKLAYEHSRVVSNEASFVDKENQSKVSTFSNRQLNGFKRTN